MLSEVEMREDLQGAFLNFAQHYDLRTPMLPVRFISLLEKNIGFINPTKKAEELQPRSPLMVVIGDSVTAGHFEMIEKENLIYCVQNLSQVYVEQFKQLLQEACGISTLNMINSGLAGDNIRSMEQRLSRDVLRYSPNLVIFNGTLNWSSKQGNTNDFEYYLRIIIERIQKESESEVVLLTPNMAVVTEKDMCLHERVEVIRKLALEYQTCLGDVYDVWETFLKQQNVNVTQLLANQENHPTVLGHTIYATLLMKLFLPFTSVPWVRKQD